MLQAVGPCVGDVGLWSPGEAVLWSPVLVNWGCGVPCW